MNPECDERYYIARKSVLCGQFCFLCRKLVDIEIENLVPRIVVSNLFTYIYIYKLSAGAPQFDFCKVQKRLYVRIWFNWSAELHVFSSYSERGNNVNCVSLNVCVFGNKFSNANTDILFRYLIVGCVLIWTSHCGV